MKTFRFFWNQQDRRPAPKHYYRPAKIEAMRFPQGLLVQSIR